jgi:hypothetical protein
MIRRNRFDIIAKTAAINEWRIQKFLKTLVFRPQQPLGIKRESGCDQTTRVGQKICVIKLSYELLSLAINSSA